MRSSPDSPRELLMDFPLRPAREELRRQAADAAGRLAELRERAGDGDGALAALGTAGWGPYNEQLHQRIMRLQAQLGRPDAVRRTYGRLQTRLAELDVEPDDATEHLLGESGASAGLRQRGWLDLHTCHGSRRTRRPATHRALHQPPRAVHVAGRWKRNYCMQCMRWLE
jgi:DNA-binding SARP family transcriptional activator